MSAKEKAQIEFLEEYLIESTARKERIWGMVGQWESTLAEAKATIAQNGGAR